MKKNTQFFEISVSRSLSKGVIGSTVWTHGRNCDGPPINGVAPAGGVEVDWVDRAPIPAGIYDVI